MNRHGARESAEAFAARVLARADWARLAQAAAALASSGASDQRTGEALADGAGAARARRPATRDVLDGADAMSR